MSKKVAVIGSGIAGLSAALALQDKGMSVRVFEAARVIGGHIQTEDFEGEPNEWGPQSLLSSHSEFDRLMDRLDIRDKVRTATESAKSRYVFRGGKPEPLPLDPLAAVCSSLLGPWALGRVLLEPLIRKRDSVSSVNEFFSQRLGKKVADNFIDPFVSGVHSGDSTKLSAKHAFPKIYSLFEEKSSLLLGGLKRKKTKTRSKGIVTFEGGMRTFTQGFVKKIIHEAVCEEPLRSFAVRESGDVDLEFGSGKKEEVEGLVLAVPPHQLVSLLKNKDTSLTNVLEQVPQPPIVLVHVLFDQPTPVSRPRGFGVLMGRHEPVGRVLGILTHTDVFPRSDGRDAFTVYIGGRRFPDVSQLSEEELISEASTALERVLGVSAEKARFKCRKITKGIPQYEGHQELLERVRDRFHQNYPTIRLVGNWCGGISVLDTAQSARETVEDWQGF